MPAAQRSEACCLTLNNATLVCGRRQTFSGLLTRLVVAPAPHYTMASMIGKWVCCPELTTGFEEFQTALGTPEEVRRKRKGRASTLDMSRDGDTWHVTFNHPDNAALPRSYVFQPGVETEFPGSTPGHVTKSVVDVTDNTMQTRLKYIVDGEVKSEWETVTSTEGDYLVFKSTCRGKVMVEKFKKV